MNSQDLWGNHSALWFPSPMPCADKQWRQCQPPFLQHWRQGWKCCRRKKKTQIAQMLRGSRSDDFLWCWSSACGEMHGFHMARVFSKHFTHGAMGSRSLALYNRDIDIQSSTRSFSQTNNFSASEVRSTSSYFPMLQNCLEKQNTKFANYIISSYFKRFHCCMLFCKPLPFPKHRTKTKPFCWWILVALNSELSYMQQTAFGLSCCNLLCAQRFNLVLPLYK